MAKAKASEIFVAGGMPRATYIDREDLRLEESLKAELFEGYKVICIRGLTKSGKTVLCKRVLGNQQCA